MSADGIILVTGGSRGIGAATATLLAAQGKAVVVVDIWDAYGGLREPSEAERERRT